MYTQSITRERRTAFVIAIDCSGSMVEEITFDSRKMSKSEAVSEVTNRLIFELIERARRSDGVRDYYDVSVVGYSGEGVCSMLDGAADFVPIDTLSAMDVSVKERMVECRLPSGEVALRRVATPCWVKPCANGETPMFEALLYIRDILSKWVCRVDNVDSFPPMVFNITDGESSDASPQELLAVCEQIKSLHTTDGNVLLVNIHITNSSCNQPLIFPTQEQASYINRYAQLLYDASSQMPECMNDAIRGMKHCGARPPFRGMSCNASIVELLTIFNIGSMSIQIQ